MRHQFSIAVILAALACASPVLAQGRKITELVAPRDPGEKDVVRVRVETGPLPFGARLVVKTEQGDVLGSISSYGVSGPNDTRSASFPLPARAVVHRRVRLQVQIEAPGAMTRSATPDEITRLDIVILPRRS